MRIAMFSSVVNWSLGVPHYTAALARAFLPEHEVHIFAARADRTNLEGATFHHVPTLSFGSMVNTVSYYAMAPLVFRLVSFLSRRDFDVVIGPGPLVPLANVVVMHFVQQREIELHERGAFPDAFAGLRSLDYALYSRFMRWLESRHLSGDGRSIVAISRGVKQDLVTLHGLAPATVAVIPNGVDTERFHPSNKARYRARTRTELGIRPDETAILFVGNSWGRKGLRAALDAMAGLGPERVRLVVVGAGLPGSFLAGRPANVVDRVLFVGERARDIERYYAAADVFLLPTLYEPFGLVVLEALASGLPTVVSALAGAAELLHDGVDSLLLRDPTDAAEIRDNVQMLIDAPELARRLGENGRRTAEKWCWSRIGKNLLASAPNDRTTT